MRSAADQRVEDRAGRTHGVFTRADAHWAGFSRGAIRHRVDAGRWVEVGPGVYRVTGMPVTWVVRVTQAVAIAGGDAAASHRAAAQLHGIPGFDANWVEIVLPSGTHRPALPRRSVHYSRCLPQSHVTDATGIPVTTVARTIADLGAVLDPRQTERALDNCLAGRLVTMDALRRVHRDLAAKGRPGIGVLRSLLDARGDGYVAPTSDLERRFLEIVAAAGLPHPEREVDLGDGDRWIGRVEFVYRPVRLLVEVDGRRYHTALVDLRHDRERDNAFMAAGWRVLRIDHEHLFHRPDQVAALLRRALGIAA